MRNFSVLFELAASNCFQSRQEIASSYSNNNSGCSICFCLVHDLPMLVKLSIHRKDSSSLGAEPHDVARMLTKNTEEENPNAKRSRFEIG